MSRASRWTKVIAFIILALVGLYAGYFTARIKIANEHVIFSRAALLVPHSGAWASSSPAPTAGFGM